jgi:hypothetical protein
VVFFFFTELDHGELVGELLLDTPDCAELVFQGVTLAHQALRARLVVPQAGAFGFFIEFG